MSLFFLEHFTLSKVRRVFTGKVSFPGLNAKTGAASLFLVYMGGSTLLFVFLRTLLQKKFCDL